MRASVDAARARAPTPSRARRGGDRKRRTPPVTILAAARGNVRVDAMAIGGGHTHHHNHHHDHGHGWFKSRAARDLEKWHKTQEGRAALELADRETRGAASTKALQMVKDHVANEAPKPDTLVHQTMKLILSCEAVANFKPSGKTATEKTESAWPCNTKSSSPERASQTRLVLSLSHIHIFRSARRG